MKRGGVLVLGIILLMSLVVFVSAIQITGGITGKPIANENITNETQCTLNYAKICHEGNVFWKDSCNVRGSLVQECSERLCENGECLSALNVTTENLCSDAWKCKSDYYKGYQSINCEWSDVSYCPNGCSNGACLSATTTSTNQTQGEQIQEQVKCIFRNSKAMQKCYTAGDNSRAYCSGTETCVASIFGYQGEKITWKSSCGSYAYTTIDRENEYVKFDCVPQHGINETEIQKNGFKFAYWQCHDGSEMKFGDGSSCYQGDVFKRKAEEFCNGKCKEVETLTKCGVNSFSVLEECYAPSQVCSLHELETKTCSYFGVDYVINRKTGSNFKVSYNSITEEFSLEPLTEITLQNGVIVKRGAETAKTNLKFLLIETKKEIFLICKDSCPLDNKCYPFGYRKSGKYCSDTGQFVEQFEAEKSCDNNFECSSNVCVNGSCVSGSFIQRIMEWFKRLFGGE